MIKSNYVLQIEQGINTSNNYLR